MYVIPGALLVVSHHITCASLAVTFIRFATQLNLWEGRLVRHHDSAGSTGRSGLPEFEERINAMLPIHDGAHCTTQVRYEALERLITNKNHKINCKSFPRYLHPT